MRALDSALIVALGLAAASPALAASGGPGATSAFPSHEAINSKATGPTIEDPFEKVNRGLYSFNKGLDRAVMRPLAMTYRRGLPKTVRTGVRNGLDNLDEPNTLMNDVLQGRFKDGGVTAARFVVNSTIGVAGLFDVAGAKMNLPIHYSDFGQTLGRYGVGPGPYVYVPVFGPSDVRDGLGRVVDSFTGILNIHDLHATTAARLGLAAVDGLDTRAEYDEPLKELNRVATDPYATVRAFYVQSRADKVSGGHKSVQDLPDFDAPPAGAAGPAQGSTPPSSGATPH
ncbi:MlaA family lipoprotein [Phenylobacterium montanum]|uniref:VacJ family lipoprotein n=1 Tax=Phenylobacterium montanum TaxID=2823693 RepID=A0A975IST7_9CAUL|nr:VacJ family lipoprotein [Caulobacter sp. S6]QUD86147.1 VacJ family lipoprotein [Caulobacter sp. S6]